MQHIATQIFNWLDRNSMLPKLNVLVWGMYHELTTDENEFLDSMEDGGETEVIGQHCFVKGQQILYGQTKSVAIPVSRIQLRDMEPGLDILDYDPGCNWVGRHPARFHD